MNGDEYGLHEAMRAEGLRVVAGPGPLREVLPEALGELAEAKTPTPAEVVYLLWSNKHGMWWRPASRGYTDDINEAGRYTQPEALVRVLNSANSGILNQVTCMVAAPENWTAAES